MTFFDQYISTRHPNSPQNRTKTPETAVLAQQMASAMQSADNHANALYCLREGIIRPGDLPADVVAI